MKRLFVMDNDPCQNSKIAKAAIENIMLLLTHSTHDCQWINKKGGSDKLLFNYRWQSLTFATNALSVVQTKKLSLYNGLFSNISIFTEMQSLFLGQFKMASMQNTDSNVNGKRGKSLSQSISRGVQPCIMNVFAIKDF